MMEPRSLPSFGVLLAAAVLSAGLIVGGCKKEESAAPAAPTGNTAAKPAETAKPKVAAKVGGVSFEHPADWKPIAAASGTADTGEQLALQGPPGAGGEPGVISVEIRSRQTDDLTEILDQQVNFLSSKRDFKVRKKETVTHPSGFEYALLEYNNTTDVGEPTAMQQWSIIALLPGKKRVQVQVGCAESQWATNEPIFKAALESLKLPK